MTSIYKKRFMSVTRNKVIKINLLEVINSKTKKIECYYFDSYEHKLLRVSIFNKNKKIKTFYLIDVRRFLEALRVSR